MAPGIWADASRAGRWAVRTLGRPPSRRGAALGRREGQLGTNRRARTPRRPPFSARAKPATHNTSQTRRPATDPRRAAGGAAAPRPAAPSARGRHRQTAGRRPGQTATGAATPRATPRDHRAATRAAAATAPFEECRPPAAQRSDAPCWLMKWWEAREGRGMPLIPGQSHWGHGRSVRRWTIEPRVWEMGMPTCLRGDFPFELLAKLSHRRSVNSLGTS